MNNILDTLHRSTDAQKAEGQAWYRTALTFCQGAAERYDIPTAQAVYALAALSPQQSWGSNQRSLIQLLETGGSYGLQTNVLKARKILQGFPPLGPNGVLNAHPTTSGFKVRAFAECILAAGRTSTVCVDRHAADVALGRPTDATPLPAGFLTRHRYETISAAYRLAAQRSGGRYTACEVQAITWITRRNDKYRAGAFD